MRCRGRAVQDCKIYLMVISGDKLMAEKGGISGDLERNKHRKIEKYGNKRLPPITLSVWNCASV